MIHAVIMAGGRGERFWPYGRRHRPKQFLRLFGEETMLQRTVKRLQPFIPLERVWVVTTAPYAAQVEEQLSGLPADHIIVEPEGRNTAPCVALALAHLRRYAGLDGDAVMAVLPADHWIGDEEAFRSLLAAAGAVAQEQGGLITLGIEPTAPETGYGYIEVGRRAGEGPGGHRYHHVVRFVEKPSRDRAEAMLARGGFMWNSGMFLWRLDVLEHAFVRWLPDIAGHLPRLGGEDTETIYRQLPVVSIDVGIMEKADDVLVFPAAIQWSDVGSWSALGPLLPGDGHGNSVRGNFLAVDCRGCIAFDAGAEEGDRPEGEEEVRRDGGFQGSRGSGDRDGHLVVAIGLEDMVIVRTPEATLVCPRDRVQDVREVVRLLEEGGREHLL